MFRKYCFQLLALSCAFSLHGAENALQQLVEGNNRYINSTTVCHEDWSAKRAPIVGSQSPFAVIVTCSDSRVPPEIIFDQTLGSLFVVRVAGNVVDDFAIGSVEYGVSALGARLVLVLGHSNCGAVEAVLQGKTFDNHIQEIVTEIKSGLNGQTKDSLEQAIKANVAHVVQTLKTSTPVLKEAFDKGTLTISGGYYDLASGKVEFLSAN